MSKDFEFETSDLTTKRSATIGKLLLY